jgi:hypothetical protein
VFEQVTGDSCTGGTVLRSIFDRFSASVLGEACIQQPVQFVFNAPSWRMAWFSRAASKFRLVMLDRILRWLAPVAL